MSKTVEEMFDSQTETFWDTARQLYTVQKQDAIQLAEEYAAQSYTSAEVIALLKQALEDAAERAKAIAAWPDYIPEVDKESITNINVERYLSK